MRILMLTDLFKPIIGGLEQHVQHLAHELVVRGHTVAVATLWHEGLSTYEVDRGVRIYRIQGTIQRAAVLFSQSGRRFAPPLPDPEAVLAIKRIIQIEQPEIVHAHSWIVHSFLPIKAWSGAKLVVTLHDYSLSCATKMFFHKEAPCSGPALKKCLNCTIKHYGPIKALATTIANWTMGHVERSKVDQFIAVSHAVAEGNRLTKTYEVIPNFISTGTDTTCDISSYLNQLPEEDYILFVGALSRHKGISVLLDAYKRLERSIPLVIIGATWADQPIPEQKNITILTNWPHTAVMAAWKRARMGIVPSIWPEPCPTVVMEAMLSGKPVIASQVGGLRDLVVHNKTGILTPTGDAHALAEAITYLLVHPDTVHEMGKAATHHVKAFTADVVVSQLEMIYTQLTTKQRCAPTPR